jgi:hypothetical protein
LTVLGGALGGTMVFDYGFNVETAGDSPVWHRSEADVLPGEKPAPDRPIDLTARSQPAGRERASGASG